MSSYCVGDTQYVARSLMGKEASPRSEVLAYVQWSLKEERGGTSYLWEAETGEPQVQG